MILKTWAGALRARLIDDARRAWRFASVQIAAFGAVLTTTWSMLPDNVRDRLPAPIANTVPTLIFVAVIFGRLLKRPEKNDG